jgi:hypothetical protein
MKRRYTSDELDKYFGDREFFRQMTADQVSNIINYLIAKHKLPETVREYIISD